MNVTGPAARAVFTGRNETTAGLHNRQRFLVFRGLTRGSPHAGSDDVGVAGLLAAAVAFAAATAKPAQTTLARGEAYSVNIAIALSSSGTTGFWIVSNDAATPDPNLSGGPGTSPLTAKLTAPVAPGTYTYKLYGVNGAPSAGQSRTTTYSITVTPTPTPTPTATADTTPPTTLAPYAARVRTGRVATLWYQVNDRSPNGGTVTVVIVIRTKAGKVVKTLRPGARGVNAPQTLRYRARLRKGTYVFTATATDAAGNASRVNGSNRLVVKRASREDDRDD